MTVHVCHGCGQVWWGGYSKTTEHESCYVCNDNGPPKGPDGLEDVEGVQGGERQIDSHEPG